MSQKDLQKLLADHMKLEGNLYCADCGAKGPKWASASLGIYICYQCSGDHRHIGTQYSFVKSPTMDQWSQDQVNTMLSMGNSKANSFWEAKLPSDHSRPTSVNERRQFIKDKYVKRVWVESSSPVPPEYSTFFPGRATGQVTPKPSQSPAPPSSSNAASSSMRSSPGAQNSTSVGSRSQVSQSPQPRVSPAPPKTDPFDRMRGTPNDNGDVFFKDVRSGDTFTNAGPSFNQPSPHPQSASRDQSRTPTGTPSPFMNGTTSDSALLELQEKKTVNFDLNTEIMALLGNTQVSQPPPPQNQGGYYPTQSMSPQFHSYVPPNPNLSHSSPAVFASNQSPSFGHQSPVAQSYNMNGFGQPAPVYNQSIPQHQQNQHFSTPLQQSQPIQDSLIDLTPSSNNLDTNSILQMFGPSSFSQSPSPSPSPNTRW
ncbi:putative Stromal membrane-associated protein 1 [Blattamonas nauphoetae]|uniref:Stromal membrane-associated protein 1 n=1 Tax=Blattamonas nauphoetae TaxID=2049346 RepID=A0ABQ9Y9H3_9EUKA|nr:putative Stromal membrane-associated protein 1 [Blattamonas nauphoetae]